MPLDLDAIRRRWAATPWTNGRTPELAADIAAMFSELDRLTAALAAAQAAPVVEWRGDVGTIGVFNAIVSAVGWVLFVPLADGSRTVIGIGPETGPSGKAAAEAAYRRACGLPAIPACAG